jgi:probable HAF family extracellular repeat protein
MSAAHHARRTLLLAILLALPPLANAQSGGYRLTDLGLLPNSSDCNVSGLNNRGQVVGTCYSNKEVSGKFSSSEAFVYADGVMSGLGVLPGQDSSYASAISDNGTIIGSSYSQPSTTSGQPTKPPQGFLYRNQTLAALNNLPEGAFLSGISANGQILGVSSSQSTGVQSFLYNDGIVTQLPISAEGITNPRGQVLSMVRGQMRNQFALYDAGRTTVIDIPAGTYINPPSAFNDAGQMVGEANIDYGQQIGGSPYGNWWQVSAYLYAQGKVSYLGFLPGYNQSSPSAINQQGLVVGTASYYGPLPPECTGGLVMNLLDYARRCQPTIHKPTRPFLYANQHLLDLNTLLSPTQAAEYILTDAIAINDAGQIAATASVDGHVRAVLLTPVDGTTSNPPAQAQSQSPALVAFQGSIQAATGDGSLRVRFEPGPVAGQSGQVFVVAMVPTAQGGQNFFLDSYGGWQLYSDCSSAPAYSAIGPLAVLADIPLLGQAGLSQLGGSAVTVYIGYGLAEAGAAAGSACRDMLKFQNYLPLLTL